MANTLKTNTNSELIANIGGQDYKILNGAVTHIPATSTTAKTLTDAQAKALLKQAVDIADKDIKNISPDAIAVLKGELPAIIKAVPDKTVAKDILQGITFYEQIINNSFAQGAGQKGASTRLITNKYVGEILGEDGMKSLANKGFNRGEFSKVKSAYSDLVKLISSGDKAKIEAHLIAHSDIAPTLAGIHNRSATEAAWGKLSSAGVDLDKFVADIATDLPKNKDRLKVAADEFVNASKAVKDLTKDAAEADVTEAKEALKKAETEMKEVLSSTNKYAGKSAEWLEKEHPDVVTSLKTESKDMGSLLEGFSKKVKSAAGHVADTAAEAGGSIFSKGAKEIAEMKAAGKVVNWWSKLKTPGKIGVVAAAGGVTYALVSAVGNSGPGEHAQNVSRGQGASLGVGV